MGDPLEALIYNPERDGPLKTAQEIAQEIAAEQEAEYQRLLRTGGTRILVRRVRSVPTHFRGRRGIVVGCHQEQCPTCRQDRDVIDVRLEGGEWANCFFPYELSSPSALKSIRGEEE